MTAQRAPLLEVDGLTVSYTVDGETREAVTDVTFSVGRGEVVAIVGESGSGKSTTAHAVIHLLARNARVDAGAIRLDGEDLTGLSPRAWRGVRGRRIGLIPQDPGTSLNPVKRIGRQVGEPLVIHGLASRRAADGQAVTLLGLAGIPEPEVRAQQFPHQFSGGMRQRIMIAMALSMEPELIIADEPTTALDVTVQAQILDLLAEIRRDTGAGLILITHDLAVVSEVTEQIVVMRAGRMVERGSVEAVFSDPQEEYTRRLLDAVPRIDDAIGDLRTTDIAIVADREIEEETA